MLNRTVQPWRATRWFSYGFCAVTVAFFALMILLFAVQSLPVWRHAGTTYLTGKQWFYRADLFGTLPMLYGTLAVSVIALVTAGPIGVGTAVFLSEYLPNRLRVALKIALELLAGIPSVVYGLLGILFLRNWIYTLLTPLDPLSGDTLLTAGLLLGVMVLPTVATLSDDALRAVPVKQRRAAHALGLNRAQSALWVSLPQAASGILAALLLATGRALGETIAVFLVVGRQDNQWPASIFSLRPLIEAGQTLTSKLGGSETNIAYGDPLHWAAMVALGLVLLVLVSAITLAGASLFFRDTRDSMDATNGT